MCLFEGSPHFNFTVAMDIMLNVQHQEIYVRLALREDDELAVAQQQQQVASSGGPTEQQLENIAMALRQLGDDLDAKYMQQRRHRQQNGSRQTWTCRLASLCCLIASVYFGSDEVSQMLHLSRQSSSTVTSSLIPQ